MGHFEITIQFVGQRIIYFFFLISVPSFVRLRFSSVLLSKCPSYYLSLSVFDHSTFACLISHANTSNLLIPRSSCPWDSQSSFPVPHFKGFNFGFIGRDLELSTLHATVFERMTVILRWRVTEIYNFFFSIISFLSMGNK